MRAAVGEGMLRLRFLAIIVALGNSLRLGLFLLLISQAELRIRFLGQSMPVLAE